MRTNIYKECGVVAVTEELLLGVDSEDSLYKEHRTEINWLLGEFVKQSPISKTAPPTILPMFFSVFTVFYCY
jgi:hypothetical protein